MKVILQVKTGKLIGVYDSIETALKFDQDGDFYPCDFEFIKKCKRCNEEKLTSEFYNERRNLDNKVTYCKSCRKIPVDKKSIDIGSQIL